MTASTTIALTQPPKRAREAGYQGEQLHDLSSLVSPKEIVICEGTPAGIIATPNSDHDAKCYNQIFRAARPETLFVSGGNCNDISTDKHVLVSGLRTVIEGATVTRLVDRDDVSDAEVADLRSKGVRVLRKRHLEIYLWSEEILTLLCHEAQKPEEVQAVLRVRSNALNDLSRQGKPIDDVKSAAGSIYVSVKALLAITRGGSNAREFMRSRLSPLVTPETTSFKELEEDIFGSTS